MRANLDGKVATDCGTGEDAAVILVIGQSNASNEGETPYKARDGVVNFNYIDGNCYLARDPLLGTSGSGGSFLSRLGDTLVARGRYRRVILVPLAVGASYIVDWAPGGQFYRRILIAAEKLKRRGLAVTHILFHQGESDAAAGTDPERYRALFLSMTESLRREGVAAPVYVAVATVCGGPSYPAIRVVQKALPDPAKGIYPGPDTDTLGLDMRFDGSHFSSRGLDRHAAMWFQAIKN